MDGPLWISHAGVRARGHETGWLSVPVHRGDGG
jgi:hypothetical protein